MRAKTLALMIAGALGISAALPSTVLGQSVERQLPQAPPPELPSVSEYSLPPGDEQPQVNRNVQGPIEENGPPPKVASDPDDAQPSSPPIVTPDLTEPAPKTVTDQTDSRPTAPAIRTPAEAPAPNITKAQPSLDSQPEENATADNILPQTETPDQSALPLPSTPPTRGSVQQTETSEPAQTDIFYYIGGGIFLLLLAGSGLYFWRRKASSASPQEALVEEKEPASTPEARPTPRKPAPKIYSPPNPAQPKKPSPISSDGFVTLKIGAMPAPQSAPKVESGYLRIEFIANGASSTLLNAVLNYTVTLTNISDRDMNNIRLSGAMIQADSHNAKDAASRSVSLLHEAEVLSAGETVTFTGDIRLPLSAIRPITFKSQALFIPLVHFGAEYLDSKSSTHHQGASFIIGQEYEPPRAKMAPFRLDLGPRSFAPVGQRPLAAG